MLRLKLILVGLFLVLLMLVAFQNAETVMLQFFLWDTTMPLVVLVLSIAVLAFFAGFAIGRIGPKFKRSTKTPSAGGSSKE